MTPEKQPDRLADLDPREEAPDKQAEIKGGIQPPHGLSLTARPPLDPPNG